MPTQEELELEILKQNSPYALPDDAASSGWTTAQKKEKFYAGLLYLYELFKTLRTGVNGDIGDISDKVDEFSDMVAEFVSNAMAVKDDEGNVIKDTYAKKSDIASGDIPAVKYKKADLSTEPISAIEPRLMALIAVLQGYFTGGKANNALLAEKSTADANGRDLVSTYETKANVATVQAAVNKILTGESTANKALKDGNNNTISSTYETKEDATAKVALANLQSILGLASTSVQGLMSASDKAHLDALYALLGDSSDSDTVVNTINEVLAIFDEYPESVDLVTALAAKVAFSDVINNLTSNEISKPLSAYQGKLLDGRLSTVEANYVDHDDVFAAGMLQVVGYDQSTGKITIKYNSDVVSLTYNSSTGVLTIAY